MLAVFEKWVAGLCAGVALVAASNYAYSSPSTLVTSGSSSNAATNSLVGTSTTINFTATGQPYVYYPTVTGANGYSASLSEEKSSAPSAFSPLTTFTSGIAGAAISGISGRSNAGNGYQSFEATVTGTDGTAAGAASFTNSGYTYADSSTAAANVGNGMSFTYSIPALTTQTIDVLVYTESNPAVRLVVSDATGTIYDDGAAGITLNNTGSGGSYKGGGYYSLNLTNTSPSADPMTFALSFADFSNVTPAGVSPYLGFEGAYVTPEPSSAALLLCAAAGVLLRRRRSRRLIAN